MRVGLTEGGAEGGAEGEAESEAEGEDKGEDKGGDESKMGVGRSGHEGRRAEGTELSGGKEDGAGRQE